MHSPVLIICRLIGGERWYNGSILGTVTFLGVVTCALACCGLSKGGCLAKLREGKYHTGCMEEKVHSLVFGGSGFSGQAGRQADLRFCFLTCTANQLLP